MKFGELKSIGHNIADSLASGIGLMIGVYELHVFEEASRSENGHITIDFLRGKVIAGKASPDLASAIILYKNALPDLCARHGVPVSAFSKLEARFGSDLVRRPHFVVTVADHSGKESVDTYYGVPGTRARKQ